MLLSEYTGRISVMDKVTTRFIDNDEAHHGKNGDNACKITIVLDKDNAVWTLLILLCFTNIMSRAICKYTTKQFFRCDYCSINV